MIALLAAAPDPPPALPIELYVFTLATLTAGVVTGAKGRYVWLAIGLFLLGIPWLVSCFLLARPGSLWATSLYGPEKLSRAERRRRART